MKSADLRVGMEVAVQSNHHYLGDDHGPSRAVIIETDVYDPAGHGYRSTKPRTKHQVQILDRRTGKKQEAFYYLDGKNIICPWIDAEKDVIKKLDDSDFARKRAEIQRQLDANKTEKEREQMQRIHVLANALGIIPEAQEVSRYPVLNLTPRNSDLNRLEQILMDAMQNRASGT